MKIKIVCWGTENEMFNTIKERGLYELCGDECKKSYHIIEGNKVEVVTLDENTSLLYKECCKNLRNDITALFIDCEDERKSEIIQQVKLINKKIMIVETCNDIKLMKNTNCTRVKHIYFVEKEINVNLMVYFILDNYENKDENYGLTGFKRSEISYEELIREILKNICLLKDYKNIELNLHLGSFIEIKEMAWMEDILKEYIVEDSMLIIKQSISKNMDNNIYFNLIYR